MNKELVNDKHSQLNQTYVRRIVPVNSIKDIMIEIRKANSEGKKICVCGSKHAMGSQQFGTDMVLLDIAKMNKVISFDNDNGLIEVEAGIKWTELIDYLIYNQRDVSKQWAIAQKQTGADDFTISGTLSSNSHGRGLRMKPFIDNIESFQLINAEGKIIKCSRKDNSDLFKLVIGGYGLFGIVYSVTLRLVPRFKVKRIVEMIQLDQLISIIEHSIKEGFLYGDFQLSIDEKSNDFLKVGVLSLYKPVDIQTNIPSDQKQLSISEWQNLAYLAHTDKKKAFELYTKHYLSTTGQVYWSDTHQLSTYLESYHQLINERLGITAHSSEIITEIFIPKENLGKFIEFVREDFRKHNVNLIYSSIRFIEKDTQSFLAWAKTPYACIVFNLHTIHTKEGIEHSKKAFQRLIDLAIFCRGSYSLAYHKFATLKQIKTCYPEFEKFLKLKEHYDHQEIFQSNWYIHYKDMLKIK